MEQIEKERFFTMAKAYDAMAQNLVPMYDMLQRSCQRRYSQRANGLL